MQIEKEYCSRKIAGVEYWKKYLLFETLANYKINIRHFQNFLLFALDCKFTKWRFKVEETFMRDYSERCACLKSVTLLQNATTHIFNIWNNQSVPRASKRNKVPLKQSLGVRRNVSLVIFTRMRILRSYLNTWVRNG